MTKNEALRLALEALEANDLPLDEKTVSEWELKTDAAITAIKAALEAKDEPMEFFDWYDNAHWGNEDFKEGCHRAWNAAIKYTAKPTQEAKDEPVAWMRTSGTGSPVVTEELLVAMPEMRWNFQQPLYTTPLQRTWVGLTDKDWKRSKHTEDFQKGVDWAEAMLKAKNSL